MYIQSLKDINKKISVLNRYVIFEKEEGNHMKKMFSLIGYIGLIFMILMLLGMSGCSRKIELREQTINGITMSIPSDYGSFKEEDGFMVGRGPDASITVSPVATTKGIKPSWWTEETLRDMYKNQYIDIVFKTVQNNIKIDNLPSVYANFTAKDKNGNDQDIRLIVIYKNSDQAYINYVMFAYGKNCSTSQYADDIVRSIKVKK